MKGLSLGLGEGNGDQKWPQPARVLKAEKGRLAVDWEEKGGVRAASKVPGLSKWKPGAATHRCKADSGGGGGAGAGAWKP